MTQTIEVNSSDKHGKEIYAYFPVDSRIVNTYINPIILDCSTLEQKIIKYIIKKLEYYKPRNAFSLILSNVNIASDLGIEKQVSDISKTIKSLTLKGIIIKWQNIDLPSHIIAGPKWYFVNPFYIRVPSWKTYINAVKETRNSFYNNTEPQDICSKNALVVDEFGNVL